METFSAEHQEQAQAELEAQVGGLVHLYGFCQQPHTVAKLLAVRMNELQGLEIYIRTDDKQVSWESWHWTIPTSQRQAAHAAHYGPQIEGISTMPWLCQDGQ